MDNGSNQLFGTVRDAVLAVLKRNIALDEHTNLSHEGIDSITTVRLLIELEKRLHIQFREEDLTLDNFVTIRSIMKTLENYGVMV
ncbi:acyl carrier protein [Paenibacillus kobensis]|uniref:acyl carrier protein n=1 Tax=Paenibacillus kobensis TaxID=59841 RepID=UPI0013E29B19|nr:acyl carrier protein [Paenibacillus kobensis]